MTNGLFNFLQAKKTLKFFEKYFRIRTEKLHCIKAKKILEIFGSILFWVKIGYRLILKYNGNHDPPPCFIFLFVCKNGSHLGVQLLWLLRYFSFFYHLLKWNRVGKVLKYSYGNDRNFTVNFLFILAFYGFFSRNYWSSLSHDLMARI